MLNAVKYSPAILSVPLQYLWLCEDSRMQLTCLKILTRVCNSVQNVGKVQTATGNTRPGEANLSSLSGQKFPPRKTVRKGKNF